MIGAIATLATGVARLPLALKVKAGTVWVNTYNVYDTAVPFGGYEPVLSLW